MTPTVYVVGYTTESGDRGIVGYFDTEPTDGHLSAFFKDLMPEEFDEWDGTERRSVFWDVYELSKAKLPEPIEPIETI